jgi:hypothetical protein
MVGYSFEQAENTALGAAMTMEEETMSGRYDKTRPQLALPPFLK